jgi:transcriptional regulator with XRE-family HTH domain
MVSESPAVARRRLRLALRRAREASGLTQGQVAESLEWSLSKVNRIENGDVTVSSTDLRALLGLLGVSDTDTVERMTQDARVSRQRGWWDQPQYRDHITSATLQLLQFESQATAIRSFQPTLIPGLLQTRNYAESVLNFWVHDLPEADRTIRLDVRMQRRAHLFDRPDPPSQLVVLDESVLHREVGGAKVMADQLEELATFMHHPHVTVRVVPLADAGPATMIGAFTVFDLGDEENAILYRETPLTDDIVHSSEIVQRYRTMFEQMWEVSLSEEASARRITAQAANLISSLDRRQ